MANAVQVASVRAAISGNAVMISSVKATSTPIAANAVMISSVKAVVLPPTGNAVMVSSLKTVVSGSAPVANAGPDQAVEPWVTVTLSGAGSSGAALTYTWTQAGGGAVALAGTGATRTFTAPASMAGDSLLFSLSVTDDSGLKSVTADTVVVTVLPATEFIRKNGAWVPVQILRRVNGIWV